MRNRLDPQWYTLWDPARRRWEMPRHLDFYAATNWKMVVRLHVAPLRPALARWDGQRWLLRLEDGGYREI